MTAKRPPRYALAPRRDPLLDESPLWRFAGVASRWAAAIALVFAFVAVDAWLDKFEQQERLDQQVKSLQERARDIDRLHHQLALREASGNCSTLFYLVESEDMVGAGNKLLAASMQLARATNDVLYPTPAPPIKVSR